MQPNVALSGIKFFPLVDARRIVSIIYTPILSYPVKPYKKNEIRAIVFESGAALSRLAMTACCQIKDPHQHARLIEV
jgi:hypothetical protein